MLISIAPLTRTSSSSLLIIMFPSVRETGVPLYAVKLEQYGEVKDIPSVSDALRTSLALVDSHAPSGPHSHRSFAFWAPTARHPMTSGRKSALCSPSPRPS